MSFETFINKREQNYIKTLLNYLKYIFNDHFVLFLFILLGALAYFYSEFIKTLAPTVVWPLIVVWAILAVMPHFGRLRSLLEPADLVYLTPMEGKLETVFTRARLRSLIVPTLVMALISAAAIPLLVRLQGYAFSQWWGIFLSLFFLKIGNLTHQQLRFKTWDQHSSLAETTIHTGVYLLTAFVSVFVSPMMGAILGLIYAVGLTVYYRQQFASKRWHWEKMIAYEEAGKQQLLRLISIFADVPALKSQAKRRPYLDGVVNAFPRAKEEPYLYLYVRAFFRSSDYLGLYVRLLVIGLIATSLVGQMIWQIVSGILFLYLVGFQMLPLSTYFDRHSLLQVYPIEETGKVRGMQQLVGPLLIATSVLFSISALIGSASLINAGMTLAAYLVFTFVFVNIYMPRRLSR